MSESYLSETVVEKIKDDYQKWDDGDCIFIDSPTGSGKTTFILATLLEHFYKNGKRILYLVNRRILKKQLKDMISDLSYERKAVIEIELYQNIEKKICDICYRNGNQEERKVQEDSRKRLEELSKYDCVVCDECHYFLADSNYNTNTSMSFHWIQTTFQNKLSIFMSATCDEILSYIRKGNLYNPEAGYTLCYGSCKYEKSVEDNREDVLRRIRKEKISKPRNSKKKTIKRYPIERNYDYIDAGNISIINKREDIVDIVAEGGGKWLIFVDSIKYGKKLEKVIRKKIRALDKRKSSEDVKKEAFMISSGYKRDPQSNRQVDQIIEKEVPLAKVLITTSVLDNGVNIKDIELRNVILFADTETEFIQMLGRKREDAQPLNLYIYKYNKKHFCKRKEQLERRKEIADEYLIHIERKIKDLQKRDKWEDWSEETNLNFLNDCEEKCIEYQHIRLMQELSDNHIKYKDISSVFTVYGGKWYLNRLAAQNIENLNEYYMRIIKKFEAEGEYAYVREQLRWLRKDNETEDIISRSQKTEVQKALERITAKIQEAGMDWMEREAWRRLKNAMKWDLQCVLEAVDQEAIPEKDRSFYTTVRNAIYQTTTHFNPKHAAFLNKYCGFPYILEENKSEKNGAQFKLAYLGESEKNKDKK